MIILEYIQESIIGDLLANKKESAESLEYIEYHIKFLSNKIYSLD